VSVPPGSRGGGVVVGEGVFCLDVFAAASGGGCWECDIRERLRETGEAGVQGSSFGSYRTPPRYSYRGIPVSFLASPAVPLRPFPPCLRSYSSALPSDCPPASVASFLGAARLSSRS
jgi:hypothetical protein